ncbi:MAG: DUF2062 domain-containing protein [Myxococcales bacterium]|nr:DUF2062 domain-containing protein [Myxococcales bacterium]MCA9701930.1 DUF2062 domain-containing protein [Myxococcales bacterium]
MLARVRQGVLRLLRLNDSPHGVALGFTLGLGLSLIPVPFLGMALALVLAPLLGASLPATYLGTAIVNPLTGAAFYFAELWLGSRILAIALPFSWAEVRSFDARRWWQLFLELLPAFAVGGLVSALAASLITYPGIRMAVAAFQRRHGRGAGEDQVSAADPPADQ